MTSSPTLNFDVFLKHQALLLPEPRYTTPHIEDHLCKLCRGVIHWYPKTVGKHPEFCLTCVKLLHKKYMDQRLAQ